jgi:hypothetical protein
MFMLSSEPVPSQPYRISAEEIVAHMDAGQPMTVLDARSSKAWSDSRLKVCGDIRIDRDHLHIDPTWPKHRLTVVYCT